MKRFGVVVLGGVGVTAGCNLLLTDYETAGAGASSAGASHAGGNSLGTPAVGLQRDDTVGGDALEVFREGYFRLATDAEHHWQWSHWYYLPGENAATPFGSEDHGAGGGGNYYYRTLCMWTAARSEDSEGSWFFRSCRHSSVQPDDQDEPAPFSGSPTIDENALPVWLTLDATVLSGVSGTKVNFTTRVYASGLVWTSSRVDFDDGGFTLVGPFDINYGFISLSDGQFERGDDHIFRQTGDSGALLQLDVSGEGGWTTEDLQDPAALYNVVVPDMPDTQRTFVSGFVLGDDETLTGQGVAREADLKNPSLDVEGGEPIGANGRNEKTGTYLVDAGTDPSLTLDLGAAHARFEPAFEIRNWPAATFAIRLNGELLATSSANGPTALAKVTSSAGQTPTTFVFQYLGTIPAGAGDDERRFVITAE